MSRVRILNRLVSIKVIVIMIMTTTATAMMMIMIMMIMMMMMMMDDDYDGGDNDDDDGHTDYDIYDIHRVLSNYAKVVIILPFVFGVPLRSIYLKYHYEIFFSV